MYKNEICGLTKVKRLNELDSLKDLIEDQLDSSLNQKCTGTEQGRWLIRCNSCLNLFTCNASSQVWLPFDCTYKRFNQADLQKCFKNKNVSYL